MIRFSRHTGRGDGAAAARRPIYGLVDEPEPQAAGTGGLRLSIRATEPGAARLTAQLDPAGQPEWPERVCLWQ